MNVIIKEFDEASIDRVDSIDDEYVIDSQLQLHAESNQIHYTVTDRPPRKRRYAREDVDYSAYVDDPAKAIFLAYVDGDLAGQIRLRENWNRYAYVEDMAVDVKFRRLGVGRALMDRAKHWARQRQLPGIMLETQNNNVRACRFYENSGFTIGGFDNFLYKGQAGDTDEVAIFWYMLFEE